MTLNIKNPEAHQLAQELAKETGEPLLYKGLDFAKTDIASALSCSE